MLQRLRDHAEQHHRLYTWITIFAGIAAEIGIFVGGVRLG